MTIPANTVRGIVLGLVLSLAALIAVEKGAAWFEQAHSPDPSIPGSYGAPHPYLLWELPPGETVVNDQQVTINSFGARGGEIAKTKPQNQRRIVFLGDNVTFGQGIRLADTYAYDAVNSLGGARVGLEPIMLAVPDYTAMQHLNLMNIRGWGIEPDLLVIAGPAQEMTVRTYVDSKVITPFISYSGVRSFLQQFSAFRVSDKTVNLHADERANQRRQAFVEGKNTNPDGGLRMGTNEYAATLNQMAEDAIDRSVDVIFVMLPVAEDLTDSHLNDALAIYRDAMRTVATRHGIPVINGPAIFKESGRSTGQLFLNHSLLTEAGHRSVGYSLAKTIKPWMRGRNILKQGTGAPLPTFPEPTSETQ